MGIVLRVLQRTVQETVVMPKLKEIFWNKKFQIVTNVNDYSPKPDNFSQHTERLYVERPVLTLDYDEFEEVTGKPLLEWDSWDYLKLFAESLLEGESGKFYIQGWGKFLYKTRLHIRDFLIRKRGRKRKLFRQRIKGGRFTLIAFEMENGQVTKIYEKPIRKPRHAPYKRHLYVLAKVIKRNSGEMEELPTEELF